MFFHPTPPFTPAPLAFIFYNHTHGREMLDIFVHQLLVLVIFLTGVVAFMEQFTRSITVELTRTSLILLQASWFWQVSWDLQLMYLVSLPVTISLCLLGHFTLESQDFLLMCWLW